MIKKKKQEIEQGMKSARGQETSQISMIKVRESGREREGAGGSRREREEVRGSGRKWKGVGRSGKEWEGVGGSGMEDRETAEADGSTWIFFGKERCIVPWQVEPLGTPHQRMRMGITEWTSVRSWRTVQERTMRLREQWVRDNNLPLTRYGKCTERGTHLFPYQWSFQVLTVLVDEESGVVVNTHVNTCL